MSKKPIHTKILNALNIPDNRYEYIVSYVTQMIIDYHGNITDIIKEIPLNLKGNERYFTMFVIGNSTYPSFSIINDKKKEEFITSITDSLKLSKERIVLVTEYIENTILEDIGEKRVPVVDIIKKIINSNFTDIENDYIIFILGLVLTSDYEELQTNNKK